MQSRTLIFVIVNLVLNVIKNGVSVAIIGKPNAGKSTLINKLSDREIAIVTPQPGTTRDMIEMHLDLEGLPITLTQIVQEFLNSSNMAFSMYPGLTMGAAAALMVHGTPEQKQTYLPKMVSGEWTGTMNLTEPQCGTDLGLLRTKAVKQADGSYKITGTKIFISAGEHDMADNIVHLVLARVTGAPEGIKGISLFVVPKFMVNKDGSLGARNDVLRRQQVARAQRLAQDVEAVSQRRRRAVRPAASATVMRIGTTKSRL